MSSVEDNNNISIKELITINQDKINDILNHRYTDESLLFGTIIFTQSKVQSYILTEFESQVKSKFIDTNNDNATGISNNLQDLNSKYLTPGNIVDKVWIAIHHPTIKYFQSQFYYLDKESRKLTNGNNNSNINGNGINSNNNTNNNSNNNINNNHNSNNNRRNDKTLNYKSVEFRKLFDSYVKFISKCYSFYFNVIHSLINKYNLSIYIPIKKICSTLKFELSKDVIKNLIDLPPATITDNDSHISNNNNSNTDTRNEVVSEIIYTIHKCILFIGDLSRYRTLIAKTYLPLNSISKEDNNNYSKSIELYKLSLLVLPSLGDPYNHIAIIDNLKDDKFNVVYNFMRSCLTTKPSIIGFNNLINFLSKDPLINPIFKQFEKLNCLNRDKITKNDRLELLKTEFLILLNYYLLPNKWKLKEGYLFKNYKIKDIQNDFLLLLSKLDFHKQIFNDFYLKQLSILLGGFELLIDNNKNHPDLIQDKLIISNYLKFIMKYFMNMMKTSINNNKLNIDSSSSQSSDNNNNNSDEKNDSNLQNLSILLLPMIRMMLCWFRERLLPQVFIKTNFEFLKLLSILLNSFLKFVYNNNSLINKITKNNESFNKPPFVINKPKRVRLFKEDITLNEFKPINGCLHDFDDKELYKNDEKLILALIGELPEGINDEIKNYENLLKILAIVHLGKLILNDNKVNIKFNEVTGLFDIPSPPPPQTANTSTPSPSQSQISSTASSSSISLINDNLDSSLFPRNDEIANFGKLNNNNNPGKKQQYNQFSNNSKNYNNNNSNNINPQLNNTNGHYQNHHINNGKNSNKPAKINNSYSMSSHTSSSTLSNNNPNRQQNFLNNNNNNKNVTPPQVASSSTTNLFQNTNLGHPQPQSQSSSQLNQPFQQHLNQTLPPHYQQPQHQLLSEEALISNLLSETLNNGGNNISQVIDTNNLNGNTDFTTPSNHNFDINSLTPNSLHYPMFNNSNSGNNSNNSTPNHKMTNDNIDPSNPTSSNTNKFPNPSAYSMFSTFETLELIDKNNNQNHHTYTNTSASGNLNPHKSLEGESFEVFANMVDSLVGDKSINNVFMNNNNNSNNIQNSTLNSSNIWSHKNNNNSNNGNNNSANNSDSTSINNSNPDTQLSTRENSIRDENSSGTDFNLRNGINTNINKDKNDISRNNSNSNNSISNGTDFQNFNSSNLYQNFYNPNANHFLQNSNKFYQPNHQQQQQQQQQTLQQPQQPQQPQQTTPSPPPPSAGQPTDQQQYFYNQNMPNTPFGASTNNNSPQQHFFTNQYGYQQQMTGMPTPNTMQFPNYNNQAMFMQPPPPQLQQQQQQPPQKQPEQQFYPSTFNQFS